MKRRYKDVTQSSSRTLLDMFPNPTSSEAESITFFTKVFAAVVSHLTYHRGIFPQYIYKKHEVENIDLMILSGNKLYPAAQELIRQMEGIFHAFQRRYLKTAILGIHRVGLNSETTPIEAYSFKFSYSCSSGKQFYCTLLDKSENVVDQQSLNDIAETTKKLLIQVLRITKTIKPLPRRVAIRWKLLYNDDVTPQDYEPPGFMPAAFYVPLSQGYTLGEIAAPFHQVSCNTLDVMSESWDTKTSTSAATDDSKNSSL